MSSKLPSEPQEPSLAEGGKKMNASLPKVLRTEYMEMRLRNGTILQLSVLDAALLGLSTPSQKRQKKMFVNVQRKYGKMTTNSSFYMKPKSHSIVFE